MVSPSPKRRVPATRPSRRGCDRVASRRRIRATPTANSSVSEHFLQFTRPRSLRLRPTVTLDAEPPYDPSLTIACSRRSLEPGPNVRGPFFATSARAHDCGESGLFRSIAAISASRSKQSFSREAPHRRAPISSTRRRRGRRLVRSPRLDRGAGIPFSDAEGPGVEVLDVAATTHQHGFAMFYYFINCYTRSRARLRGPDRFTDVLAAKVAVPSATTAATAAWSHQQRGEGAAAWRRRDERRLNFGQSQRGGATCRGARGYRSTSLDAQRQQTMGPGSHCRRRRAPARVRLARDVVPRLERRPHGAYGNLQYRTSCDRQRAPIRRHRDSSRSDAAGSMAAVRRLSDAALFSPQQPCRDQEPLFSGERTPRSRRFHDQCSGCDETSEDGTVSATGSTPTIRRPPGRQTVSVRWHQNRHSLLEVRTISHPTTRACRNFVWNRRTTRSPVQPQHRLRRVAVRAEQLKPAFSLGATVNLESPWLLELEPPRTRCATGRVGCRMIGFSMIFCMRFSKRAPSGALRSARRAGVSAGRAREAASARS